MNEQIKTEEDLQAFHFPGSETYHIAVAGDPVCNITNGNPNDDRAQITSIDAAEEFFSRCDLCTSSYNEDVRMSRQEVVNEIRDIVGLESRETAQLSAKEVVEIYKELIDGEK